MYSKWRLRVRTFSPVMKTLHLPYARDASQAGGWRKAPGLGRLTGLAPPLVVGPGTGRLRPKILEGGHDPSYEGSLWVPFFPARVLCLCRRPVRRSHELSALTPLAKIVCPFWLGA